MTVLLRFPITPQLIREAAEFKLRSSCRDCLNFIADERCALEWTNSEQRRWSIADLIDADTLPAEAPFCKEFELR